jgi:hypothetical protein
MTLVALGPTLPAL